MPMDTLKQQAELCVDSLDRAGAFFELLEADYRTRIFKEKGEELKQMKNAQFVNYVQALDKKGFKVLVWSICATVKNPQLGGDRTKAFHAAITLCFLAASCMVIQQQLPQLVPGQVVKLPLMHPVVAAFMSMVLFGGRQGLASWANWEPQATHTYQASIDKVEGACASDRMIRAVYTALFPERQSSTKYVASGDYLTPQQAKNMIEDIELRVEEIRSKGGEDSAFTLLVDSIDAYDKSGIGISGIVTAFATDDATENKFLAISPNILHELFRTLLKAIQEAESASPSTPEKTTTPSQQEDSDMKDSDNTSQQNNVQAGPSSNINITNIYGSDTKAKVQNTNVTPGNGSTANVNAQNTNVPPEPLNVKQDLTSKIQTPEKRTWRNSLKAVVVSIPFLHSIFKWIDKP